MSVQSEINRITQNVSNTYSVLNDLGAAMPAETNSDNLSSTAASVTAVLYGKAQSLTDEQKAQARSNIGIEDSGGPYTVSLPASGWAAQDDGTYIQTASVPDVDVETRASVDIDMSTATTSTYATLLEAWFLIGRAYPVAGGIAFVCFEDAPDVDLSVNVEVLRNG